MFHLSGGHELTRNTDMKIIELVILLVARLSSCTLKLGADGPRESTLDGAYFIRAMEIISEK